MSINKTEAKIETEEISAEGPIVLLASGQEASIKSGPLLSKSHVTVIAVENTSKSLLDPRKINNSGILIMNYGEMHTGDIINSTNKMDNALENAKASEQTTMLLIDKLRACYTQGKNARLRHVLEDDEGSSDIREAFINLAIVKKEKLSENEENKNFSGEAKNNDKSEIKDQRMANTHEQIYGKKESLPLSKIFTPLLKEEYGRTNSIPSMVLIEGWAGIGKSVLCQFLANTWAHDTQDLQQRWWLQDTQLVLWIPFRNLANYDPENCRLGEVVRRECFGIEDPDNLNYLSAAQIEADLASLGKKVILLLDGFDEVADWYYEVEEGKKQQLTERARLLNHILLGNRNNHRIILTSRPNRVTLITQQFARKLETIGFTDENINQYVKRYFEKTPDQGTLLLSTMRSNVNLWGISHIPVNLTLICYVWKISNSEIKIDQSMTQLYSSIVLWLLRRDWAKHPYHNTEHKSSNLAFDEDQIRFDAQSIHLNEFEHELESYPLKLSILKEIAWRAQSSNTRTILIAGTEVSNVIEIRYPLVKRPSQKQEIINELKSLGLLESQDNANKITIENNHYYFPHLTFQEYFAAKYWVEMFSSQNTMKEAKEYLLNHKYNPKDDVMWWFVAGLIKDNSVARSEFFEALESAPIDLIGIYHDTLMIRCHEESDLRDISCEKFIARLGNKIRMLQSIVDLKHGKAEMKQFIHCLSQSPKIAQHNECIEALISAFDNKDLYPLYVFLLILNHPCHLPQAFLTQLAKFCLCEDLDARTLPFWLGIQRDILGQAIKAIGKQSPLSEHILSQLVELFLKAGKNNFFYSSVTSALSRQSPLPESILHQLLDFFFQSILQHKNSKVLTYMIHIFTLHSDLIHSDLACIFSIKHCKYLSDYAPILAIRNLSKLSPLPESILSQLLESCHDKDPSVRSAAVKALGQQSPLTESILCQLLESCQDEDEFVREKAVKALGQLSPLPESILFLLLELSQQDKIGGVQSAVAKALAKQSPLPESILTALLKLCLNENHRVRRGAIEALGQQTPLPESFLCQLLKSCQDEHKYVRAVAVKALGQQSPLTESILCQLLESCQDEHKYVREEAVKALGQQSPLPESFLCQLLKSCQDEHKYVRKEAVKALGQQSPLPESILTQLLEISLFEKEICVCKTATEVLSQQPSLPKSIISRLIEFNFHLTVAWFSELGIDVEIERPMPISFLTKFVFSIEEKRHEFREGMVNIKIFYKQSLQMLISLVPHYQDNLLILNILTEIIIIKCLRSKISIYCASESNNQIFIGQDSLSFESTKEKEIFIACLIKSRRTLVEKASTIGEVNISSSSVESNSVRFFQSPASERKKEPSVQLEVEENETVQKSLKCCVML